MGRRCAPPLCPAKAMKCSTTPIYLTPSSLAPPPSDVLGYITGVASYRNTKQLLSYLMDQRATYRPLYHCWGRVAMAMIFPDTQSKVNSLVVWCSNIIVIILFNILKIKNSV